MKGVIFRGQSCGPMHDFVFARVPTKLDVEAALAYELERHGVVFERNEQGRILNASPRKRWVQMQHVEIVGVDLPDVELPEQTRFTGEPSEAALKKAMEEGAANFFEGGNRADAPAFQAAGTGTVLNPGDPGWVPPPEE